MYVFKSPPVLQNFFRISSNYSHNFMEYFFYTFLKILSNNFKSIFTKLCLVFLRVFLKFSVGISNKFHHNFVQITKSAHFFFKLSNNYPKFKSKNKSRFNENSFRTSLRIFGMLVFIYLLFLSNCST